MKKICSLIALTVFVTCSLYSQTSKPTTEKKVRMFAVDKDLKTKMTAMIEVTGPNSKERVLIGTLYADTGFVLTFPADYKTQTYMVNISYPGYNRVMFGIGYMVDYVQSGIMTIQLERIKTDAKAKIFNSIYFDYDQALINTTSKKQLDSAVTYLKTYPNIHIEIEGHTDNSGSFDYNLTLSQQRADEVKDYLIAQGIDAKRIKSSTGYGDTQPRDKMDTEDARRKNRRVEIKLLI